MGQEEVSDVNLICCAVQIVAIRTVRDRICLYILDVRQTFLYITFDSSWRRVDNLAAV